MNPHPSTSRRRFLSTAVLALASLRARGQDAPKFPPTRAITKGPGFHWFGYYDKLQFSPDNRFVLSNKVDFEHRSPTADDVIEVGMVDLHQKDKWIRSANRTRGAGSRAACSSGSPAPSRK